MKKFLAIVVLVNICNISRSVELSDIQQSQLLNCQHLSGYTPEVVNTEYYRITNTFYNLQLLLYGDIASYHKFINPQINSHNYDKPQVLRIDSFNDISEKIRNLSPVQMESIKVATILYAIADIEQDRSKIAALYTGELDILSLNRADFILLVLDKYADFYPIVAELYDNYPEAKHYLPIAFLYNMHFRHMLFIEGGISMYRTMRDSIKLHALHQDAIDFWQAFWLLNISGFRQDPKFSGSKFLNQHVYDSIVILHQLIAKMQFDPNFEPLHEYLKFRANLVGLNIQHPEDLVLTHLCSLIGIFSQQQALQLRAALHTLDIKLQDNLIKMYIDYWQQYEAVSTEYFPALMNIVLDKFNHNYAQALAITLPMYLAVMNKAKAYKLEKVSFKKVADKFKLAGVIEVNTNLVEIEEGTGFVIVKDHA